MVDRDAVDHLCGIVALWLTNGQKPVEAGNDTRYDFFRGGWIDAYNATVELLNAGLVANASGWEMPDYEWQSDDGSDLMVWPTATGIAYVLR